MKNIGGSIFPSSCPEILREIAFKTGAKDGTLQVVADEQRDTHDLVFSGKIFGDHETFTVASHPNGYSCHELAKRMVSGQRSKACEQAVYIVACGGSLTHAGASLL